MEPLMADDVEVPLTLETPLFRLRPLVIGDVEKDYEAVMSSVEHLQKRIPKNVFGAVWPQPTMTMEEDLVDLGWHQAEFQHRTSFTYTVVSPDEKTCLGCVYIFPPRFTDADAEVFLWVRKSEYGRLDAKLFTAVREWMKKEWPFKKVAFPFRESNERTD